MTTRSLSGRDLCVQGRSIASVPRKCTIDLTLIPYHGEPYRSAEEIYRGDPKSGTSHFHAYATAYVVRYLRAARYPFLMPVARRGRKPRHPEQSQSVWRFFAWKRSGWSEHAWRDQHGRLATVGICVVYGRFGKRAKRPRPQTLVYAYWGFRPASCEWVRETYRTRFAIETTYRQMNQARIRTCTRDPLLRLLFVGLALIPRNAWVWLHWVRLARWFLHHSKYRSINWATVVSSSMSSRSAIRAWYLLPDLAPVGASPGWIPQLL